MQRNWPKKTPYYRNHEEEVNDGPKRGAFQRSSTPAPAAARAAKDFEVFDKTRDILRCVYPLNRSASKQIIISLDPSFEFMPAATISPTGKRGVKLPHYAFNTLCDSLHYITEYFNGTHEGQSTVNLAPEIVMTFEHQYGKKVLTFRSEVDTNQCLSVTIQEPTWLYFKKLLPLLRHNFEQLLTYSMDCQQLCAALRAYCRQNFPGRTENYTDMNQFEDFLGAIQLSDIDFAPRQECFMDIDRAFMELTRFCAFDLAV
jgi:hypothetical protein